MMNIFDRMTSQDGDDEPAALDPARSELIETATGEEVSQSLSDVKEATQELLKHGYIEEEKKPLLFRKTVLRQQEIAAALEPLDLVLRLDTHRGVAFIAVARVEGEASGDKNVEGDEWSHPLVRRQRLTLEQSLLIALLRQAFVIHEQETGVGHSTARIAVDDLLPLFLTYFEDSGSDSKNTSRLCSLLDQLKTYGIVSEVDKNEEITIRPLIAHLANPESLAALLRVYQTQQQNQGNAN